MKVFELIKAFIARIVAGKYVMHITAKGFAIEVKASRQILTFRRAGIVIGSYMQSIEISELNAQDLAVEAIKNQCAHCAHTPYHLVNKHGQLYLVACDHKATELGYLKK
jgi:hypothetical protein